MLASNRSPDIERIIAEAAPSLHRDGFAVLRDVATREDIAQIRSAVIRVMSRQDLRRRELGERGSVPQIVEIENILALSPELQECGFFPRAKQVSAELLRAPVEAHYDHVIFKPPLNMKETAWHQDAAYGRRLTFSSRRLHWWLPLHDVSEDRSCMRFVPGSHLLRVAKHVPAGPTSDALKTELPQGATVIACPLKEGSATIHLPTTLHSTGPNKTNDARTAFIVQYAARTRLPRFAR